MASDIPASILAIVGQESVEKRTIDYLTDLEKLQKPNVATMSTKHLGQTQFGQSKMVTIEFTEKQAKQMGTLELYQLTDMQFGHKSCKLHKVKEFTDNILAAPNRFVLKIGRAHV